MPMHIPSSIDTDLGSIDTSFSRMGPITTPLSPATQNDILGILQREQDHAMSLLSLSPLLSSLFISYANRAAALESAPATPSPESEEWKTLQATIVTLREENEKLKLETREAAGKLEAAEASQEAFRSQVSSLREVNTTQRDDIESLRAELVETRDKYDRLVVSSNAEKAALEAQVLDLEAQRGELKETVVEQQIKISRIERRIADDPPPHRPFSPPVLPGSSPALSPSSSSSPTLRVQTPLPEQVETITNPSLPPTPSSNSRGPNGPTDTPPPPNPRAESTRPVPVMQRPTQQRPGGAPINWSKLF